MAKSIRERLLEQVGKFHQWQEITYPGKTTEEIGGAWEVEYPYPNDYFESLHYDFISRCDGDEWPE